MVFEPIRVPYTSQVARIKYNRIYQKKEVNIVHSYPYLLMTQITAKLSNSAIKVGRSDSWRGEEHCLQPQVTRPLELLLHNHFWFFPYIYWWIIQINPFGYCTYNVTCPCSWIEYHITASEESSVIAVRRVSAMSRVKEWYNDEIMWVVASVIQTCLDIPHRIEMQANVKVWGGGGSHGVLFNKWVSERVMKDAKRDWLKRNVAVEIRALKGRRNG